MEEDKERLVNKKLAALIGALLIYICFFLCRKKRNDTMAVRVRDDWKINSMVL